MQLSFIMKTCQPDCFLRLSVMGCHIAGQGNDDNSRRAVGIVRDNSLLVHVATNDKEGNIGIKRLTIY